MSTDDLLTPSLAVDKLIDEIVRMTGAPRKSIEGAASALLEGWPVCDPKAAMSDRLYWVRVVGVGDRRRAWRTEAHLFPWFVENFTGAFGDSDITVLGEVERDGDTPEKPTALDHTRKEEGQ